MRLSLLDVLNKTFILTVPNIQVDSFQAPQQPRNPEIEWVRNVTMIEYLTPITQCIEKT